MKSLKGSFHCEQKSRQRFSMSCPKAAAQVKSSMGAVVQTIALESLGSPGSPGKSHGPSRLFTRLK